MSLKTRQKVIFFSPKKNKRSFPGDSDGRESACSAGDPVGSLGWEDPLEKRKLLIPVFLPGEFHGQRLQTMWSQRVGHD